MIALAQSRGAYLAIMLLLITSTPALASDTNCNALLAAMQALRNKPFHLFMTTEHKYSSATLARAAASIDLVGAKKSEEIWTGKDVFVLSDGHWIDMHTNLAAMSNDDDPDTQKARAAERCTILADDTVDGQPTTVIQTQNPDDGTGGKFWILKPSHLIVRMETVTDAGAMKSFMTGRYAYGNVQVPAHAVSMSDIIKKTR